MSTSIGSAPDGQIVETPGHELGQDDIMLLLFRSRRRMFGKMLGDFTFKSAKSFWYQCLGHIVGLNSYISLYSKYFLVGYLWRSIF